MRINEYKGGYIVIFENDDGYKVGLGKFRSDWYGWCVDRQFDLVKIFKTKEEAQKAYEEFILNTEEFKKATRL